MVAHVRTGQVSLVSSTGIVLPRNMVSPVVRTVSFGAALKQTEAVKPASVEPMPGVIKSTIKRVMSCVLSLVPKRLYHWFERRTLFKGCNWNLKVSLQQAKQKPGLSEEARQVADKIQEMMLEVAPGVKSLAWYYPAKRGMPTVLLSMGNNWSIQDMLGFYKLMKQGYGWMTYEYPGYGSSTGTPSEELVYKAMETASDTLVKKGVPVSQQIAYGVSLGGAVTAEVASKRKFKAVILESTMSRFSDVVKHKFGKWLPEWLFPIHEHVVSRFDSVDKLPNIKSPLLVLHGTEDPLMPCDFAKQLHAKGGASKANKQLTLLPSTVHRFTAEESGAVLESFLQKQLPTGH